MAESVQILSINHRHEQMADWLIANPTAKNLQVLADHMGMSRSWVSIVMRSDVFQEYWAKRRGDYVSLMNDRLHRAQMDVALKALEKLPFIIEDDETDPRLIFDIANKTVAALTGGVGHSKTTVVEEKTQELSAPVSAEVLANARETLRRTVRTEYVLPGPTADTPTG